MAKTIDIDLDEPINGHKGPISIVKVSEPRAGDILDLGDPFVLARGADGALISVENDEKIRAYIERLTQDADGQRLDPILLRQASASDLLRIRDAVIDFFIQARSRASNRTPG